MLVDWWFTVDRALLATILVIVGAGVVLSLAASPSIALRRGLPTFHFVQRHFAFALTSVVLLLAVSLLSQARVRRLSLVVLFGSLALMAAALLTGAEINGARRWLHFGGYSLQPSEFAKPAFIVLSAWLIGESRRRPEMPAMTLAVALYLAFAGLLVLQPDVGQMLLVSLVWCALFLLAGRPLRLLLVMAAGLAGVLRWRT